MAISLGILTPFFSRDGPAVAVKTPVVDEVPRDLPGAEGHRDLVPWSAWRVENGVEKYVETGGNWKNVYKKRLSMVIIS